MMYRYMEEQNSLTRLRMKIPELTERLTAIQEETALLKYQIEILEAPNRLLEVQNKKEYSYLYPPIADEIIVIKNELSSKIPSFGKIEELCEN